MVLVAASEANFCVGPKSHSLRSFHQYDDRAFPVYFLMKVYITWTVNRHQIDSLELDSFVDAADLLHDKLGVCAGFQERGLLLEGIGFRIELSLS